MGGGGGGGGGGVRFSWWGRNFTDFHGRDSVLLLLEHKFLKQFQKKTSVLEMDNFQHHKPVVEDTQG